MSTLKISTWISDISIWNPSSAEWKTTLDLFPDDIKRKIQGYHRLIDAKRSIVGMILAQSIVCSTYSLPWQTVKFSKTSNGRPYLVNPLPPGNRFDFNISHDGNVVVCCFCTETGQSNDQLGQTKVGVDVMEHRLPDHEPTLEGFSSLLAEYLTSQEQVLIEQRKKASEEAVLNGLLQFWTLKESIIKALGLGLRMELQSININCLVSNPYLDNLVSLPPQPQLRFAIDGQEDRSWTLWSAVWKLPDQKLRCRYMISAAIKIANSTFLPTPLIHNIEFKTVPELIHPYIL
ncbi:hypothetical protein O181_043556 [Austropuccinia psidii MF-1]|uniref:holo-[acyl-carrier-protein] synthase n=1 Tax=Austropuccinia psidii MF-1 TaxID=1389203 RepID=A0A9Q3DNQ9_9BASI|nr:hypothetical protein [Austropuccinia psidii MF-1]